MCATTGALIPIGLIVGNIGFETMIGLVGGGWVVRSIIAKKNPLNTILKHPMVVPWIALLMSIAISLFVNGPGSKGWAHDLVFFRYLLYFLALLDISERLPVARYLVIGLAAGVVWAVINTLSAHLLGFDLLGKPLVRYTAKLKEASRISGLSAYAFPYLFSWGILDRSLSRKIRVIVTIIGITAGKTAKKLFVHGFLKNLHRGFVGGNFTDFAYDIFAFLNLSHACPPSPGFRKKSITVDTFINSHFHHCTSIPQPLNLEPMNGYIYVYS